MYKESNNAITSEVSQKSENLTITEANQRLFYFTRRSKISIVLLILIYGGAGLCVSLTPFPVSIRLLLLGFCGGAFLYHYWRNIFLCGAEQGVIALACDSSGRWTMYDKHRDVINVEAVLQKSSVILPYLLVLHFRVSKKTLMSLKALTLLTSLALLTATKLPILQTFCSASLASLSALLTSRFVPLVIFCDTMPKEDFRRLRVCLLMASFSSISERISK